jgi:RHS repeat-associated protein
VLGSQAYDPWGNVTASTGTVTGMLGLQSAWTDPASGKDLMGARWYNPAAGDFPSRDTVQVSPVPDPAAADPFGYAAGNPLSFTDPTGHLISAGSPATNPNWQADTAYSNVFTQTYQQVGVTVAEANAARAYAAVIAAKQAAARYQRQQQAEREKQRQAEEKQKQEELARAERQRVEYNHLRAMSLAPRDKPGSAGGVTCGSVESHFAGGSCRVTGFSGGGGGVPSWLKAAVEWAGNTTGVTNAINCARSPSWSQCLQAVGKLGLTAVTIATAGGTSELEIAAGAETTAEDAGSGAARTLFHYTDEAGQKGILDSGQLNPSLREVNPADDRYGNGQYLSDIKPGSMTSNQLSRAFLGAPFWGSRFTNFVEIDVSGLNVVEGRAGVFVIPNEGPLDLTGRIASWGAN